MVIIIMLINERLKCVCVKLNVSSVECVYMNEDENMKCGAVAPPDLDRGSGKVSAGLINKINL